MMVSNVECDGKLGNLTRTSHTQILSSNSSIGCKRRNVSLFLFPIRRAEIHET